MPLVKSASLHPVSKAACRYLEKHVKHFHNGQKRCLMITCIAVQLRKAMPLNEEKLKYSHMLHAMMPPNNPSLCCAEHDQNPRITRFSEASKHVQSKNALGKNFHATTHDTCCLMKGDFPQTEPFPDPDVSIEWYLYQPDPRAASSHVKRMQCHHIHHQHHLPSQEDPAPEGCYAHDLRAAYH